MKSLAIFAAWLAFAAPALAQERTVAAKEMIGASPEAVRERTGLVSSSDWSYRFIAWHDGKRFEMLRPKFTARSSVCPGRPLFTVSGGRAFDSFLFVDGVLVATIAFGRGPPLQQGPEGVLRFEEGVDGFLADVAAEAAEADAVLTSGCYPDTKVKRPRAKPTEVVYGVIALVGFSPYIVTNMFKGVAEHSKYERAGPIMAKLQPGAILEEGAEAFARAHAGQVQWIPSAHAPGYGVLTVDLGAPATSLSSGRRKPDDLQGDAAKVGVRDGRVEWLTYDSGGPYCGRMRDNISSARVGCRQGVTAFGTR